MVDLTPPTTVNTNTLYAAWFFFFLVQQIKNTFLQKCCFKSQSTRDLLRAQTPPCLVNKLKPLPSLHQGTRHNKNPSGKHLDWLR